MGQHMLSIDVGAYSSKGVLVEPNGNIVKTRDIVHRLFG